MDDLVVAAGVVVVQKDVFGVIVADFQKAAVFALPCAFILNFLCDLDISFAVYNRKSVVLRIEQIMIHPTNNESVTFCIK